MKKFIIVFLVVLFLLVIYIFSNTTVEIDKYSEESKRSDVLHSNALSALREKLCPVQSKMKAFVIELKKQYPENLIALKGDDLLFDGFQFRCSFGDPNNPYFYEVNE